MLKVVNNAIDGGGLPVNEEWEEVDSDHATRCGDASQVVIAEIPVVLAERSTRGMRSEEGARGNLKYVVERWRGEIARLYDEDGRRDSASETL
jgi:hypothetical protein